MAKNFIPPTENLTQSHPDILQFAQMNPTVIVSRWKTEEGKTITEKIQGAGYDKLVIETIVGKMYGHLDLRGFNFSGQSIIGKNLSGCDFFSANFEKSNCSNCNFENSYFSEANIKGTNFEWSKMNGCLLDNVNYNKSTNFNGVDLSSINFTMATLLRDLAVSQQRIVHIRKRNPILATFLYITTDYGRSLSRWLCWCLGMISLFAAIYQVFGLTTTQNGTVLVTDFLTNLYYSIVTFATVGYGDVLPKYGIGQGVVMLEIGLGYLMGGLLVAILTKKVIGN